MSNSRWKDAQRGAQVLDMMRLAQVSCSSRSVVLRRGADIKPQPIKWLWEGWLPAAKLSILAGIAGTGKTTLALAVAAVVSASARWPDEQQCKHFGNVLIWSGEDSADDTLVPRLIAAGADMNKIYFIEAVAENGISVPFDPAAHISDLHAKAEEIGNVALLIVDPIVSAVTGDMHRANDVRRGLQGLVDFAETHDCAVLGVTHFAKGTGGRSPQERIIGSQAFGALARMVLVAAKEEDGDRRVLARAKSNIAPDDGGMFYSLEVVEVDDGIRAARVEWHGAVEGSAREIIGEVKHDETDGGSELDDVVQFLRDLLADGPMRFHAVKTNADGAGHSLATIRRAKKRLGVTSVKESGSKNSNWKWCLP